MTTLELAAIGEAEACCHILGLGRRLLEYGAERYGIQEVTVNEQNPQAVGFYEHMGFVTYKRTDRDEQGGPYSLLYMRRG